MKPEDKKRLLEFYQRSFWGITISDAQRVRWTEKEGQETRFRVLASIAPLEGASVLDVGSGLGALYEFLSEREAEFEYHGIDIVPEFAQWAAAKHPGAAFAHADIMEFRPGRTYDYVLASGALSFKVDRNLEHYSGFIRKMFALAGKGAGFNMLDRRGHESNDTYASYDPHEIAELCSTIAPRVELVTDYLPEDFTVFMYR